MKDEVIVRAESPGVIEVNGKKYYIKEEKGKRIDGVLHGDKAVFIPLNEKERKERIKYIVGKIRDCYKIEQVLNEILEMFPEKDLKKMEKLLKGGAKVKKQTGCLGIKIGGKGGSYLQVVS